MRLSDDEKTMTQLAAVILHDEVSRNPDISAQELYQRCLARGLRITVEESSPLPQVERRLPWGERFVNEAWDSLAPAPAQAPESSDEKLDSPAEEEKVP